MRDLFDGGDFDEFDEGVDDGVDCEDLDTVPSYGQMQKTKQVHRYH